MKENVNLKEEAKATYSPAAILNAFSNSLISPLLNELINIKGLYRKGKGVNYNGFYYDVVKDLHTEANVTIVVPETFRHNLKEGQIIHATAYATKRLSPTTSRIDLILNITEVTSQEVKEVSEDDVRLLEIIQQKAQTGYKDVDGLIKRKILSQSRIGVVVIIGISAVIDADIKHQLKNAEEVFDISFVKVNLTRADEIIAAMAKYGECDLLIVARGGGDRIEVFNNLQLSESSLKLKPALLTAIGHAVDEPLLQKIADKHFITPTALGQYLHDIYNQTVEDLNNSKSKLIEDISKQFELQYQGRIKDLTTRITENETNLKEVKASSELQVQQLAKSKNMLTMVATIAGILAVLLIYLLIHRS